MTKILGQCPVCHGAGHVRHIAKALIKDEVPNPNDLDRYKEIDACDACGGTGKGMIEVNITEPPKPELGGA
jgi:hypothetical protein